MNPEQQEIYKANLLYISVREIQEGDMINLRQLSEELPNIGIPCRKVISDNYTSFVDIEFQDEVLKPFEVSIGLYLTVLRFEKKKSYRSKVGDEYVQVI